MSPSLYDRGQQEETQEKMNPSLRTDIVRALIDEFNAVERGAYLQEIRCPSCNKPEAFTRASDPWIIKCGRENKCGTTSHIKTLVPHLFSSWTSRYQGTNTDDTHCQTEVADGYLSDGRRFDLTRIRGWYSQEYYYNSEIDAGTTTVRFSLPNGYWERLLDNPERFGRQKCRIIGSYSGQVWMPPCCNMQRLADAKKIWITGGIFDALALRHVDIEAVSNINSSNYPEKFFAELNECCDGQTRPTIVLALGSDRAGRKYTWHHAQRARQDGWAVEAAQPSCGSDWNDLWQLGQLRATDMEPYCHRGALLLADSPLEKALLLYKKTPRRAFWFVFCSRIWWFSFDPESYDRQLREGASDETAISSDSRDDVMQSSCSVQQVCSADPVPLYFQHNTITDESWYYFAIELPDGRVKKAAFTAAQLASSSEFKKRLLSVAENAWWLGSSSQLDQLMQDRMHNIKSVRTIDYIGYSSQHKIWVFTDLAVRAQQLIRINDEDYFEHGDLTIKSLSKSVSLHINPCISEYNGKWPSMFVRVFGSEGVVALAWWLGTLFAEQIRAAHSSWPFLEIVGQAGAGKSTLIEFLWKLFGRRDYEGIDPLKATTAARRRMFAQTSNLPVVLIESDREEGKSRGFEWDELKPAYNGRSIGSRGVKNSGNETLEPPFRAGILISQNNPVDASEAIISRIVQVLMSRNHHSQNSKQIAEQLEQIPVDHLSSFILHATMSEKKLLSFFLERSRHYELQLLANPEKRTKPVSYTHLTLPTKA